MKKSQKIAVIGNGIAGKERVNAINNLKNKGFACNCIGIYDPFSSSLTEFTRQHDLPVFSSLEAIVNAQPDWIIICVPHDVAAALAKYFLAHHIKILIEKPFGRSIAEAQSLIADEKFTNQIWVGFNYRFYDGIQQAYHDFKNGFFGDVITINMTLGHGGRPGDENTWKLDPVKCGGGCLLDPGIHLLDLVVCFSQQDIHYVGGAVWKGFWKTGIEEEVHLILKSEKTIFNVNVSLLRWRNTFRVEIHGTERYGIIVGRSRHYGDHTYTRGPRWGWQEAESQAASEKIFLTNVRENSFEKELAQVLFNTNQSQLTACTVNDAMKTMALWEKCSRELALNTDS
jgi:predicted dehydrogenase